MVETNLPILYLREMVLLPYNEIRLEFTFLFKNERNYWLIVLFVHKFTIATTNVVFLLSATTVHNYCHFSTIGIQKRGYR